MAIASGGWTSTAWSRSGGGARDRHRQGGRRRGSTAGRRSRCIDHKRSPSSPCRRRTRVRSGRRSSACSSRRVARAGAATSGRGRSRPSTTPSSRSSFRSTATVGTTMNALAHCAEAYYHPATTPEAAAHADAGAPRDLLGATRGRRGATARSPGERGCSRAPCTPRSRSRRAALPGARAGTGAWGALRLAAGDDERPLPPGRAALQRGRRARGDRRASARHSKVTPRRAARSRLRSVASAGCAITACRRPNSCRPRQRSRPGPEHGPTRGR